MRDDGDYIGIIYPASKVMKLSEQRVMFFTFKEKRQLKREWPTFLNSSYHDIYLSFILEREKEESE